MPKRRELIKYVERNNAKFLRQAKGSHEIWIRGNKHMTTIKCHTELKNNYCRKVCKDLGIPSKW